MDLLGLLSCRGLPGADGPDGLVGDDDPRHILGGEIKEDILGLGLDHLEVLSGLPLIEVLTDTEDDAEPGLEGELHLLDEFLVGLPVVLPPLGMAEDGPLATDGCQHPDGDLSGVGSLGVIGAVLGGNLNLGAFHGLSHGGEVGERSGHDQADTLGGFH